MSHVFISYSRDDLPFVRQLKAVLESQGRSVWVDLDDIPPSAEWMNEIHAAINAADAVVFVLSPSAIDSAVCAIELEHAASRNKRLLPILYREIAGRTVPQHLSALNWIVHEGEDEDAALGAVSEALGNALDTDLDRVRAHSRLLVRAAEWESQGRSSSAVLRGAELRVAQALRDAAAEPALNELQEHYLAAGHRRARHTRNGLLAAVAIAAALVLGAALTIQQRAREARIERAERLVTLAPRDPDVRLLIAAEAATSADPVLPSAWRNLIGALYDRGAIPHFEARGHVRQLAFAGDGTSLFVIASSDDAVRQWALDPTTSENPLGFETLPGPRGHPTLAPSAVLARLPAARVDASATLSANGRRLAATGRKSRDALVWDLVSGQPPRLHRRLVLDDVDDTVVALDPGGRWLVTRRYDASATPLTLWDLSLPEPTAIPVPAPAGVARRAIATFSADGASLATSMPVTVDGRATWRVQLRSLANLVADVLPEPSLEIDVERPGRALALGPRGRWLFAGKQLIALGENGEGRARIVRDMHDEHPQDIITAAISVDGQWLLTAGNPDGRPRQKVAARLWNLADPALGGRVLPHYERSERSATRAIVASAFDPRGRWLATASLSSPSRIHLWPLDPESPIAIARRRLGRNFTETEWIPELFLDEPFDATRPFGGNLEALQ